MSEERKPRSKKEPTSTKRSNAQYDIQARYLSEIGKYDLLTPEGEQELGKRISEGDEEAKKQLILANLRLVVTIAKRYTGHGPSLMETRSDSEFCTTGYHAPRRRFLECWRPN